MNQVLIALLSLGFFLGVIILCLKDKFNIAIPLIILSLTSYPLILGLICQYAFQTSALIPYFISFVLIILAILSIFIPNKKHTPNNNEQSPRKRWAYLLIGIVAQFAGILICIMFWYEPGFFGQTEPMPMNGVISNIVGITFSSIFFYLATLNHSIHRPNLICKVIVLLLFVLLNHTAITLSSMLLYSFPISSDAIFPLEAGVNMISHIIWAILLIAIKRECVVQVIPTINGVTD